MGLATGISRKFYPGVGLLILFITSAGTGAGQALDSALPAAPSVAEQEKFLAATRDYAQQYVSNLPNFLCVQVTEQFEAGKKVNHWHRGDTLTSKLVYNQGRERRSLELVNDKPPQLARRPWRTPLTTEGEFGMLLGSIFNSTSDTSFSWNRWEVVRGKRLAVFDFAIDREHSKISLSLSDLVRAIVPYHGSIYTDPDTGAVWRVTSNVTEIPPQVQTRTVSTTIEYEETAIGSATYLLPVQASVWVTTGSGNIRNEIQFKDYRKFEADSTITYTPGTANSGANGQKATSSTDPP